MAFCARIQGLEACANSPLFGQRPCRRLAALCLVTEAASVTRTCLLHLYGLAAHRYASHVPVGRLLFVWRLHVSVFLPNYSLKRTAANRLGVDCNLSRQRPLSSSVRPHRSECLLVVFHIAAPDAGTARPACAVGAVSQLAALREKPASHPAARAFCAQASPFRFASALCDLCCNRA